MFSTRTVTFAEVTIFGQKTGRCGCGKRRARSMKFYQTLNPFNKNKDGAPKTREEILVELKAQRDAWKEQAITCEACKPARTALAKAQS